MGIQAIALILSLAFVAVLALLLGRLLATMLKICLLVLIIYFVFSHINPGKVGICHLNTAKPPTSVLAGMFCKP